MNEPIISLSHVSKSYGNGTNQLSVLGDVSLDIYAGEIISIVGPSGAGKSTLLNIIGCLDGFQQGDLSIEGKNISRMTVDDLSWFRNRHLGFVFQLHNLLPEFTALENVMMPLLIRRVSGRRAREQALKVIDRFKLADRAHHKPGELSGGEAQRIAVARAIVGNPAVILADEPTGSLDRANSKVLIDILFEIGRENKSTIIIVTHDPLIASMTERTVSLLDGKIESDGNSRYIEPMHQ